MQNFHLYTMVWGSHHLNLFKRACLKSLLWPKNLEAIRNRPWHIFTKQEHFEELHGLLKDKPFQVKIHQVPEELVVGATKVKLDDCDIGTILLNGLRGEMYWALTNKSRMLFCPPDTIFGDGTIENMILLGKPKEACVAVVHPRVLPSIMDDIDYVGATRGAITNSQLVTMAFKHAHDSWKFAEVGHERNTSLMGGIAWKKLSEGLYSVTHQLPTHYFCEFTEKDWSFWWGQCSFGSYDHRWPGECLIRQERQRLVGSSDACFIVEVTDWDKNVPALIDKSRIIGTPEEDTYVVNWLHNSVNKQTSVILRGD